MTAPHIHSPLPSSERQSGNGHASDEARGSAMPAQTSRGLSWERRFGVGHPYDAISWERRTAKITKGDGTVVFEQRDVEVPAFWTQTATDIVASKYFRGKKNTPQREASVKQMIDRVAKTIGAWGLQGGYFATPLDAQNFTFDLTYLLVNQYFSFNSPVWFNVGVSDHPQCSACFILAVEDTMPSILEWYREEGLIFKGGSGSGLNLSKLRSSKEQLSKGGYSSGPVSFMKGADGVANTIKSGGATRRAAKMVVLNVDHPDLKDFIYAKKHIEDMTSALVASGFTNNLDGDLFSPYTLLPYQNANNSVRVSDAFMQAVEADGPWEFKAVTTGETIEQVRAREVMDWIADAAWHSADPGMQYDTTINRWHTCPNTGPITASNPCSEYMHIDNSACNLASLNLLKYVREDGVFETDFFRKSVDTIILAQEIIVGFSSYPTEKIGRNAVDYRQLGLGYANLGALLMVLGLPYDSDEGRALAGQITSLMCGEAYRMSADIASRMGPFAGYAKNREPMLRVLDMHRAAAEDLYRVAQNSGKTDTALAHASRTVWHEARELAEQYGVRNAQVTVLAPTGTIAFMMDCDTTGIEPDLALVKYKKLVGGGILKLVNGQVPAALARLGYSDSEIQDITAYLMEKDTIEGAPHLRPEHLAVFDCSFKAQHGTRSISYMGHLRMMSAAQPFISGAISKTVNLPHDATVADVRDAYIQAWKLGLKAIAVYRDGSKGVQPLNTSKEDKKDPAGDVMAAGTYRRDRLPNERPSVTHRFSVAGHEGYLIVGLYPESRMPGEVFISIAKEGSTVSGLLNTIAILISVALQSGVPLASLVRKFKDMAFTPAGFTENQDIPTAKSITDYVFRYLGLKFLPPEEREAIFGPGFDHVAPVSAPLAEVMESTQAPLPIPTATEHVTNRVAAQTSVDAPVCQCGTLMVRAGSCYSCPNCFATTGVCN
ncbi:MAG: vitamin B12-dependent ribonucleotide reductase [Candidatus Paceibacterota bacterium]|nr:MAG: vitamin B12-dependent ribonucleotide reductase [Candidatus Paceibacterota bacterium]